MHQKTKDIQKRYDSLCLPSKIYTTLAFVGLLFSLLMMFKLSAFTLMSFLGVFLRIVFYLFWTWVLDSLCKKGYTTASWILLALPYILVILYSFILVSMVLIDSKIWKRKIYN